MLNPNEPLETPDYVPGPPRAWDESKCCPAECDDVCEIPAGVVLSDN